MNSSKYLSYLDLMCCGFGGAMLMFLIVASASSSSEPAAPILIILCSQTNPSDSNQAIEMGLQYKLEEEKNWHFAKQDFSESPIATDASQQWSFSTTVRGSSGTDFIFICNHPKPGNYLVRAFSADTALEDEPKLNRDKTRAVEVKLEVFGATERITKGPVLIDRSVQFTPELRFKIDGR